VLEALVQRISKHVDRYLERQGWLVRDGEQSYLNLAEGEEKTAMDALRGHSITYRIALGPKARTQGVLETPYRDGTTHVVFEPPDFIARLAALVPKPRVHLTRFHGVFAPNSDWRAQVTPAKRGPPDSKQTDKSPAERHAAMNWAKRLKCVFNIDIETYEPCGGTVKIIASIEDPAVIKTILDHLEKNTAETPATRGLPPAARVPPQASHPGPNGSNASPDPLGTDAASSMTPAEELSCRCQTNPKTPQTLHCHSRFLPTR
jgi:hypothetical protein